MRKNSANQSLDKTFIRKSGTSSSCCRGIPCSTIVTLYGQVTRPTLKSDAEAAVKSIEGVSSVVNNIEVLPVSPMDDQLRRAVYRAIYGEPALSRYSIQAVPSIHIIVKNGNVTLEGVVDNETDKNLAGLRANGVPNVFSVKNNLAVAGDGK
jgi:hyperosmotically inducible protein